MEMSILIHKENRGQITPELFSAEHQFIEKRLMDWRDNWDPALTNPSYFVTEFPNARPLNPDDIVDPFAPNVLYHEPLFPTTMLTAEWHSIMVMHKCQSSTTERMQLFGDLARHAFGICQTFEAIENWPHSPKGCLIMIQACIAIGALFLPQEARYRMWSRRKFALLETMGYVRILLPFLRCILISVASHQPLPVADLCVQVGASSREAMMESNQSETRHIALPNRSRAKHQPRFDAVLFQNIVKPELRC